MRSPHSIGLEKILRFQPRPDLFYRPPSGPPGLRLAGGDVLPFSGRQYCLEILPTAAVEPDRAYSIRIEGSSMMENRLSVAMVAKTNGAVTLAWGTELGKTYRVQFKSSLNADAWTDLVGDVSGTGGAVVKVDTAFGAAPQRFYRVVELP